MPCCALALNWPVMMKVLPAFVSTSNKTYPYPTYQQMTFCVHNNADNNAFMYVWPESLAHRGANEVVSCLHHYLSDLSGFETLFLFSDSCPGQNKNTIIMHYLYSLVRTGKF